MQSRHSFNTPRAHASHAVAGFVGIVVASAALAGVIALFGDESGMPWLAQTPANQARLSRCDAVSGAQPHRDCVEHVVAAVMSGDTGRRMALAQPRDGKGPQVH